MLQHRLRRLLLFIRWVAILAQQSPDHDSQLRPGRFLNRPVDGGILPDGYNQLLRDPLITDGTFRTFFRSSAEAQLVQGEAVHRNTLDLGAQ